MSVGCSVLVEFIVGDFWVLFVVCDVDGRLAVASSGVMHFRIGWLILERMVERLETGLSAPRATSNSVKKSKSFSSSISEEDLSMALLKRMKEEIKVNVATGRYLWKEKKQKLSQNLFIKNKYIYS